jgi:UDP-N-acetylmuramyl pentapeptide synthase
MLNKVQLNPDGVIEIWVVGDQTAASVREMGEKVAFYITELRAAGRPVLVLDNLLRLGHTSSDARREVARLARALAFDRLAMAGGASPAMRYGTNLMLRAIGRTSIRYFASPDSAREWLCYNQSHV